MLSKILDIAILNSASDIHITLDTKPAIRKDGDILFLNEFNKLTRVDIKVIIEQIYLLENSILRDIEKIDEDLDFALNYEEYRLRINIFRQKGEYSISIRIIPKNIPTLEELYLPKQVYDFKNMENGLILITGKSGSGKSTTLAAIIEDINKNESKNILTLEDPIEYIYENKNSIINQREIGRDVDSFKTGIKSSVRQDPDIIVLGELRDLDTISSGITLAETGHLVIATMHSRSAIETISRIIDVFPGDKQNQIRLQFANSIRAIISQELFLKKSGGRIVNCEIMMVDNIIRNLIKNNKPLSTIEDNIFLDTSKLGSKTREQSLAELIDKGYIDYEYITDSIKNKDKLKRLLNN